MLVSNRTIISAGIAQQRWSSNAAFLLAQIAAAIGLGSLWRFPYLTGRNGGAAFVLVYIGFVIFLSIPIMLSEMIIGKCGRGSASHSVAATMRATGASRGWGAIGVLSNLIAFLGLSYYSVVASWCIDYARRAIFFGFASETTSSANAAFADASSSVPQQLLLFSAFLLVTASVVSLGLSRGIETLSRVKVIALLVTLLAIIASNAVTFGLGPAAGYLFAPNFAALTPMAILTALGQALFSAGVGVGVMMTFSAYSPEKLSLPRAGALIALAVIIVSILAGLAIFPPVLHFALHPEEGPGLIFVTLPVAFSIMGGGRILAIAFFTLFTLSAFASGVGLLEASVAWLRERTGWTRPKAAFLTAFAIWLAGLAPLLSFGPMKRLYPLEAVELLQNKTVFDLFDMLIGSFLLPINAALIGILAGWVMSRKQAAAASGLSGCLLLVWRALAGVIAPASIATLMLTSLF